MAKYQVQLVYFYSVEANDYDQAERLAQKMHETNPDEGVECRVYQEEPQLS